MYTHPTTHHVDWKQVFNDPDHSTEANALVFLWEIMASKEIKSSLDNKLITINSTRNGDSYHGEQGHRPTTRITCEYWLPYYNANEPQSIFAVVEQPYLRLADQLRVTVLTKAKKAGTTELIQRINNTAFHFAFTKPSSSPLISVVLDEIARHVFGITQNLKYLDELKD